MNTKQDDGGPAQTQPQEEYMAMMREANSPETKDRNLRDWFAGMFIQGGDPMEFDIRDRHVVAKYAYMMADAMLAARKEQP